jgi:hypothetical protein
VFEVRSLAESNPSSRDVTGVAKSLEITVRSAESKGMAFPLSVVISQHSVALSGERKISHLHHQQDSFN